MEECDMVKIVMELRDVIDQKFNTLTNMILDLKDTIHERDTICTEVQKECDNKFCSLFVKESELKIKVQRILEEIQDMRFKKLSKWRNFAENIIWFIRIFVLMVAGMGLIKWLDILK